MQSNPSLTNSLPTNTRPNKAIEALIMDMAGTCVDFGSLAPVQAFLQLFAQEGVPLTEAQARAPMGTEKREHIRQLLAMPEVASQWQRVKGQAANEQDIDRLYQDFLPLQLATIGQRAELIAGYDSLKQYCQQLGIAMALNTGYNRTMVEAMLPQLSAKGLQADSLVCAPEVPKGRPYPHMSLKNALELGVSAVQCCIKVDDTLTGIEEGRNAGMWTVAVSISGNALGLDWPAWQALSAEQQAQARAKAEASFAGRAHYVIDSIAQLPELMAAINLRLAKGELP